MDDCVSGLHVVLVNDWCICQLRSCGATISQPAEEWSDGWRREGGGDQDRQIRSAGCGKKEEVK